MLVTFTTNAYADITMFGDVGLSMLKMMGHSATVPGAILAADVPAALAQLQAALAAESDAPAVVDEAVEEPEVSLAKRGLPLVNLLAAAAKAKNDVMWK
jgi:chromosome segregation and condensation protein ScpB